MLLAVNRFAGGHRRQRAAGRNAECEHRLADDVLAQNRAERRAAVAIAREGCQAGTFELNVVTLAVPAHDFAEQDRTAISEARVPATELVARVYSRDRFGAVGHVVAGYGFDPGFGFEPGRIDTELCGEFVVDPDQRRVRYRHRRLAHVETLRQLRVGVIERNGHGLASRAFGKSLSTYWGSSARLLPY